MYWIYKATTWFVLTFLALSRPLWRRTAPKFAKWFQLRYRPEPVGFQPRIWVHAVSVGEINIALALLGANQADEDILVTTSTRSGFAYLTGKLDRRRARYLPWDQLSCYRRLFAGLEIPDLIVIETEIWPHLFRFVTDNGARLTIVNGRLSRRTLRFRKLSLLTDTLARANAVAVRGESDRDRFLMLGVDPTRITVTGNIKFDFKPMVLPESPLTQWLAERRPLVFASISADEAPMLSPQLAGLRRNHPDRAVLWAPRHLDALDTHLAELAGMNPVLRSMLAETDNPDLLVLDTFGELSGCYAKAVLSLIGGSFNDRGGQNFLESLQAGTPALMGPNIHNFKREVEEALAVDAIQVLGGPDEVAPAFRRLLDDPDELAAMAGRAQDFLSKGSGAIDRTRKLLLDLGVELESSVEET